MSSWSKDLKYAYRSLTKTIGFSITSVLLLTLGLGLTIYMFSAINAYILKPLPFPDPEELVHLEYSRLSMVDSSVSFRIHDYLDFQRALKSLGSMAAFYRGTVNIGGDVRPERYDGGFVTANTFDVLGVSPILGRNFLEGEDQPGAEPAVLLGHNLWIHRYAANPTSLEKPYGSMAVKPQ